MLRPSQPGSMPAHDLAMVATVPGTQIWFDDFLGSAGTAPDSTNWSHQTGRYNSGAGELQYYTSSITNCYIDGASNLVIKAIQENPPDNAASPKNFTSTRLVTRNLQQFAAPVRIAARIKLPYCRGGVLPAFWMVGSDPAKPESWPHEGEIDIMEYPAGNGFERSGNMVPSTIHGPTIGDQTTQKYIGNNYYHTDDVSLDYHVYGVDWYPDRFVFWFDYKVTKVITQAQFAAINGDWAPFYGTNFPDYILLNIAVGGNYATLPDSNDAFPMIMLTDWVGAWSLS